MKVDPTKPGARPRASPSYNTHCNTNKRDMKMKIVKKRTEQAYKLQTI